MFIFKTLRLRGCGGRRLESATAWPRKSAGSVVYVNVSGQWYFNVLSQLSRPAGIIPSVSDWEECRSRPFGKWPASHWRDVKQIYSRHGAHCQDDSGKKVGPEFCTCVRTHLHACRGQYCRCTRKVYIWNKQLKFRWGQINSKFCKASLACFVLDCFNFCD